MSHFTISDAVATGLFGNAVSDDINVVRLRSLNRLIMTLKSEVVSFFTVSEMSAAAVGSPVLQ